MTANPAPRSSTSHKSILLSVLLFIFIIFLWLQGVVLGIGLILPSIVFFSARLFSLSIIGFQVSLVCSCVICFYLIFYIKRQSWVLSIVLLIFSWGLPLMGLAQFNTATARVRVEGRAMENSISDGGFYLVDRETYQQKNPQRGDVIVYSLPDNPGNVYISRVIGLPGEQIDIKQGLVYINDAPLQENYTSTQADYMGQWKMSNGQYFVLGDNRNDSNDSHAWGELPKNNIIGKVVWAYWPLDLYGDRFYRYLTP